VTKKLKPKIQILVKCELHISPQTYLSSLSWCLFGCYQKALNKCVRHLLMTKVFLSRLQFVTVSFRGPKSERTLLSVESHTKTEQM
jgi:hypothetical protein